MFHLLSLEATGKSFERPDKIEQVGDSKHQLRVTLTTKQLEKLQHLKGALAATGISRESEIFDLAMDALLEKVDPIKKETRSVQNPNSRRIASSLKQKFYKRDNSKCTFCDSTFRLEIDHILHFSMGGKSEFSNFRLVCRNHNQRFQRFSHLMGFRIC